MGVASLEFISVLLIMYGIFKCKFRNIFVSLTSFSAFLLIVLSTIISGNEEKLLLPLGLASEVLFVILSFSGLNISKISIYLLSFISSYIISLLEASLLALFLDVSISFIMNDIFWYPVVMIGNIVIILLISLYIKNISRLGVFIAEIPVYYFLIGFIGLLSAALVLVFVSISRENSTNNVWDKMIVLSCGIICTFFIVGSLLFAYIYDSKKRLEIQDRINKELLDIQQKYYRQIIESSIEVRRLRHDMVSHIGCMKILLKEKKLEELACYINEISNDVDSLYKRKINSGNDTIDALLNYMYHHIDEKEIEINFKGECYDELPVKRTDITILISNLVQNAIEACKMIKTSSKKNIDIVIQSNKNKSLYFSVENPVEKEVDINLIKRSTSKKDKKNHGFGIGNVEIVVSKYNGNIKYINENGKFRAELFLWFNELSGG